MMAFRNESIKARILGILGVLAVGYLLLLSSVQFTAQATHRHMQQVSSSLFPAALQMQQAETSFVQLNRRYNDAVLLEDPKALVAADKEAAAVTAALTDVRNRIAYSPPLSQRTDMLLTQFAGFRSRSRQTYAEMLASKDNVTDTLQLRILASAKENKEVTEAMHDLDESIAVTFQEELNAIDGLSIRSRVTTTIMFLVALMGCIGAWYVLQYRVVLPLQNLARRMKDIAEGDGDLTDRVQVIGSSELDEVGRWFNIFIERVEQIVLRVMQNARALAEAATGLAEISRETALQSALQQDQAMRIANSMSDISTAAHEISSNTQNAARDAQRAEQNAQAGGETIRSTVVTIQQLLAANRTTATKIEELGEASDAIGKIINVIDDIANQTNLLALNASIEAARAGEHGRGFAVVAGEVRRLADRTRKATREIHESVRAIQDGTSEVVDAMHSSMRHVESGVSSARSAGEALKSIIHGSEAVQRMVTQIASASTEQSQATRSVNDNLNEIASILERTTSSSANAAGACDRLSHLAGDLNQLVGAFKVRGEIAAAAMPMR
jgi:methyl-accepting chemotaxis protein